MHFYLCPFISWTPLVLLKFKIKSTNLCDFCSMLTETLDHLFWYCSYSQHFWNELTHFLKSLNINIQLNLKMITFGITDNVRNQIAINYILICAKYFIFVSKCLNTIPQFPCFKNYFNKRPKRACIALLIYTVHGSKYRVIYSDCLS